MPRDKIIKILALSGSLRKDSYNTMLLNAISQLVPNEIEFVIFNDAAKIPLFNPDHDNHSIPVINTLRTLLKKSDGLLISSPEYAHGISGVLKNMLDWLVSGDEFPYIPVVLCNTSPRASHALIALREVISTMSGITIDNATITLPLLGTDNNVDTIVNNTTMSTHIRDNMEIFRNEILQSSRLNKTY
ncbi:MAG: NADPH-dependent FMN reductase [Gammaproteobacteria bacterium]